MTIVEWLAWLVLLIVALWAGVVITLSNARVAREVRRLAATYRHQKSLELEQLQAQTVALRQAEVEALLAQHDGWRRILDQLLADALSDTDARVGTEGLLNLSATPAPYFVVAGEKAGRTYLFTTVPPQLPRWAFLGKRRHQVIPIDASLYPAARLEVQAVWEHLVAHYPRQEEISVLPRQAKWYLVVQEKAERPIAEKRAAGLSGSG